MPDAYHELLEATIHHLEDLKGRGVRFVSVSPGALKGPGQSPRLIPAKNVPAGSAFVPRPAEKITAFPPKSRAVKPMVETGLPLSLPGDEADASPVLAPDAHVKAAAF